MGTIVKTQDGTWRAQVRRKGKYADRYTYPLSTEAVGIGSVVLPF